MNITQLKKLVKQGESEMLEFKTSTANLSAGMQTVCAFLNSDKGGTVIFGVKDDGKIVGQEVTDTTKKNIATEINEIEPHTKINVSYISIEEKKQVIVITVDPGEKAPYAYDGRSFMRNQSTTLRMTHEVFTYLYNKSNPTAWESRTNNKCTLKDLDKNRIKAIVKMAVAEERLPKEATKATVSAILQKLDLLVDNKLTNAAVILFCKNEYKQFMQSAIKMARFRGTTRSEFLNQKMIRANAFDLYDKAIDFLLFSLPVAAKIVPGKAERLEIPAIPYTVLREALTNALVHRDYSQPGTTIDIAMYDDRVTIDNPGFLPKGVNLEQLSQIHKSIPRNPLIANVFYLCGKIEKWGRGTLDMIQDCKKAGNPTPKFQEIGGGFAVTLPLKEPMLTIIEEPIVYKSLTDRQRKILSILKQGPLNRQQIMKQLDSKLADRTMQLELTKLKKQGLIKSEGQTTAIMWFLSQK